MENLSYEQLLVQVKPELEGELLSKLKYFKFNGYMVSCMSYEQAFKIFRCHSAALQLIYFKNRISNQITNESDQPKIIKLSSSLPWPNQFIFPVKDVAEDLAVRLNNPFYDLGKWDIIRLVRILFNKMILYRIIYPTGEQYNQAVDSVLSVFPNMILNDPTIKYKLRTKIRAKFGNYRQNLKKSGLIDLKKRNTQEPRCFDPKAEPVIPWSF